MVNDEARSINKINILSPLYPSLPELQKAPLFIINVAIKLVHNLHFS